MPFLTPQQAEADTLEAKQARMAVRVGLETRQSYETLCNIQKSGIRTVWENDQGLTPQQVCDSLGSLAIVTFQMHGALTNAIKAIAALDGVAPDIFLPTFAFTPNPDGTITILDTPYVP